MIQITARAIETAPDFQSLTIITTDWAATLAVPGAIAAELVARIDAGEIQETITPEVAAHVLHHFHATGGMEPGAFTQHLMAMLQSADRANFLRLAAVFPGYALAVNRAANVEDGIRRLQEIAKQRLITVAADV